MAVFLVQIVQIIVENCHFLTDKRVKSINFSALADDYTARVMNKGGDNSSKKWSWWRKSHQKLMSPATDSKRLMTS